MKNKSPMVVFLSVLTVLILIFLFSQPSLGVELEECKDCHGKVKPIATDSLTKGCMTCHSYHGGIDLTGTTSEDAHNRHAYVRKTSDRKDCQLGCHRNAPVECESCHNSHENIGSIKIPDIDILTCTGCHGELPQPGGHSDFRKVLSNSKHRWMNCRTCHLNVYNAINNKDYEFKLHFKGLYTTPIDEDTGICKICHSPQYEGLKGNTHGKTDNTCADCHDAHTTKLGPKIQVTPKETPVNISTTVESTKDWITTKVPILKNTTAVFIIIIIIVMTIAEYILSRGEEGKKTAYHTVKIHGNEDKLKTLEVRLKNQSIGVINDILRRNDVDILGMTMIKEEDKENKDAYKYVIFTNTEKPIDEKSLINQISATNDVKSAIFTDRYEL